MQSIVEGLANLFRPWADLYGGSAPVEAGVMFVHFAGLLLAGGFALAFDRGALRMSRVEPRDRQLYLAELGAVHRPVLLGLTVVVVSGFLLLAADVEALLPSPIFWVKMGVFALLIGNGVMLRRAERRLAADVDQVGWARLRRGAVRSIALWLTVLFLGTVLPLAV